MSLFRYLMKHSNTDIKDIYILLGEEYLKLSNILRIIHQSCID